MNISAYLKDRRLLYGVLALLLIAGGAVAAIKISAASRTPSRLTFLVSGHTHGFLENCGCSGGQSGGLHRRATMLRAKRAEVTKPIVSDDGRPSETLTIDIGDFSDPGDPRQKLRSKGIVKAMELIGYDAVGLGQFELGYEHTELLELLSEGKLPYICANLEFTKPGEGDDKSPALAELVKPYRVVTLKGGYKVGVIHVVDSNTVNRTDPSKHGYRVSDAVKAVETVLAAHSGEAPFWVLSVGTNKQFGLKNERFAHLDTVKLVFGMRGYQPEGGENGVQFPYFIDKPMDKGKDVTVASVTFAEKNQLRVTAMKVGIRQDNFKPDPEIDALITALKPELIALEDELGEQALNTQKFDVPVYVGFQSCATCHTDIAMALSATKHMHAYETLKAQDEHHNSCARCHNNGFNQPGGFNVVLDKKYDGEWVQRNVQCETCHGPGEYHVKLHANNFSHPKLAQEGRNQEGLLPPGKQRCIECHDSENSPGFNFDKYWPFVQHGNGLQPKPGSPEGAGMGTHGGSHAEGASGANSRRDRVIAQLHAML